MIVVLLAAAAAAAVALARAPSAHVFHAVDSRLCPFPLDVKVVTADEPGQVQTTAVGNGTYTVSALSKSGTHFTITKSGTTGVSSRGCDNVGQGGCKAADAQNNQW